MMDYRVRAFVIRVCDVFAIAHTVALVWLMILYTTAGDGEINFLRAFIAIAYCVFMSAGLQRLKFSIDKSVD